jgi:hypothetical protein
MCNKYCRWYKGLTDRLAHFYSMKTIKSFTSLILVLALMFGLMSCVIVTKHDNGLHRGWHKSSGKSLTPGHSRGKH